jgi:hypothetical protein
MNNFPIERTSTVPHIALGRIKKLELLSKNGRWTVQPIGTRSPAAWERA